jgi:hypothetical protein
MAEKYLRGLDVEDWGCGEGRFRDFHVGGYAGIDGSDTDGAVIKADLRKRLSAAPGILLRHVLEHNFSWQLILENALKSCTDTLVIVLFTPFRDKTEAISWTSGIEVPDIGFALADLRKELPSDVEEHLNIYSPSTQYGVEHYFVVRKENKDGKAESVGDEFSPVPS